MNTEEEKRDRIHNCHIAYVLQKADNLLLADINSPICEGSCSIKPSHIFLN